MKASHPPPGSLSMGKGSRKGRSSVGDSKSMEMVLEELQLLTHECMAHPEWPFTATPSREVGEDKELFPPLASQD